MATLYADLTKKATDLVCKPFPVTCEQGPRDHTIVKVVANSQDGVKVEANFESTKAPSSEASQVSKIDISKDYKERDASSKFTINSKDTSLAVSYALNNKLGAGSKVQIDGKHFTSKSGPEVSVGVTTEIKKDNVAANLKGEIQVFSKEWAAEAGVVARHGKYQGGLAGKFAPSADGPVKAFGTSLSFNYETSSLVVAVCAQREKDVAGLQYGAHAFYHLKFCSECDGQVAAAVHFPVPVLSQKKTVTGKIAGQYNPTKDSTLSAVITSSFDLGVALKLRVNDHVTVSGSTYAPALSKAGDRVFGLNVDFTA